MKVLFKNRTIYTKRLYIEAQEKWYKLNKQATRFLAVVVGVFCLASACYYISQQKYAAAVIFSAAVLAMIFVFLKGNYFQAVRAYNQQKNLFPENGFEWQFQKRGMCRRSGNYEKEYAYKDIQRIYLTRHTICMIIEGSIHILDKKGFENGMAPEFINWLIKQSPRAFRK